MIVSNDLRRLCVDCVNQMLRDGQETFQPLEGNAGIMLNLN